MTLSTLEDAVSILEKWLRENTPEKSILLHINPKEVQEALGFSPPVFWYALYQLRDDERIRFYQPLFLSIYNDFTKEENS